MHIIDLMAFCPRVTFMETVKDCQPLIFKSYLKQRYKTIHFERKFYGPQRKDELTGSLSEG